MVPGEFRRRDVTVGGHLAPDWGSVPAFLKRAEEVYAAARGLSSKLIAIACAHHRIAWVHPFRDGNGRVVRLQSQAALIQHGAGSALWSVSRGIAAPAGLPKDVEAKLVAALEQVLNSKEHQQKAEQLSLEPKIIKGEAYRKFLKDNEASTKKLMGW